MKVNGKYRWMKHLDFMLFDLFALLLAFVISYWLKFGNLEFVFSESWKRFALIISLLNILIAFWTNPYSGIFRRAYYQETIKSLQLMIYNLLISSVIFYLFKIGEEYSREMVIYMYAIYFALSLAVKYVWKKLLISGKVVIHSTRMIPLFIISGKDNIQKNIENVTAGDFQIYEIKGIHLIDSENRNDKDEEIIKSVALRDGQSISVIGDDYIQYILQNNIEEVLLTVSSDKVPIDLYEKLASNGIDFSIAVEAEVGFQPEEQYISNIGVYKALSIKNFTFTPIQIIYFGLKRILDILCSLFGLLFLIPVTLIVKVVYLASGDTAKIFYRQTRVGLNGKLIKIFKFRSMVTNADVILKEMLKEEKYRLEWEEKQKFDNDPRITKAGKILRKTSIDELPQLINVLIGDMSLVGPRPLVVGELEAHDGLKIYQKVKPGITGWWGCNGRSNISYRERLDLEYYYVKNCSLYLDLLCLLRTVVAVLKKDGAQ